MSTLTLGLTDRRKIERQKCDGQGSRPDDPALGTGERLSAYRRTSAQPDFWRSVMTSRRLRSTWRRSAVTG